MNEQVEEQIDVPKEIEDEEKMDKLDAMPLPMQAFDTSIDEEHELSHDLS